MDIPETLKSILWIGALFFGLYWLFRSIPMPNVEKTERVEREIIHYLQNAKSDRERKELEESLMAETKLEQKAVQQEISELEQKKIAPLESAPPSQDQAKNTQLAELKWRYIALFNKMEEKIQLAEQKGREILALNEEKEKIIYEYEASKDYRLLDKIKDIETQGEAKQKEIDNLTVEINDLRTAGEKIRIEYKKLRNSKQS